MTTTKSRSMGRPRCHARMTSSRASRPQAGRRAGSMATTPRRLPRRSGTPGTTAGLSLIACRTVIGFGAPNRQGTRKGAWRAARCGGSREDAQRAGLAARAISGPGSRHRCLARNRCAADMRRGGAWIERSRRLSSMGRSPFHDALNRKLPCGYADVMAQIRDPVRHRTAENRHPAGVATGDRRDRGSAAQSAWRLGRSDPFEPDAREDAATGAARCLRWQLYPLRRPRACHGGCDERHRAAWRLHPLWRHVSQLCRLQPPRDQAGGVDGDPRHPCDDARLDRAGRRRSDASAGRASGVAAGDTESAGIPPGRRGRDRGGVGLRVAGRYQSVGAVPVAAGAPDVPRR